MARIKASDFLSASTCRRGRPEADKDSARGVSLGPKVLDCPLSV